MILAKRGLNLIGANLGKKSSLALVSSRGGKNLAFLKRAIFQQERAAFSSSSFSSTTSPLLAQRRFCSAAASNKQESSPSSASKGKSKSAKKGEEEEDPSNKLVPGQVIGEPEADEDGEEGALTADTVFAAAAMCYSHGDIEAAEKIFHEALTIDPQHSRSLLQLGVILFDRNDPHGALTFFEQAVKNSDSLPVDIQANAYFALARCILECQTIPLPSTQQQVIDYLNICLEKDPNHTAAMTTLAAIYQEMDDDFAAEDLLERAMYSDTKNVDIVVKLAGMRMKRNNLVDAKRVLEYSLKDNPGNDDLLVAEAKLELLCGDASKGENQIRKVLSKSPDHPEALIVLGQVVWVFHNKPAEALKLFERALVISPGNEELSQLTEQLRYEVQMTSSRKGKKFN